MKKSIRKPEEEHLRRTTGGLQTSIYRQVLATNGLGSVGHGDHKDQNQHEEDERRFHFRKVG